jgi:hypothetical protein
MNVELTGPSPTKMEELAVERVIACWLEMEYLSAAYPVAKGETLVHARFVLRQRESAERRFQAAMKSLTTLRALLPECRSREIDRSGTGHAKSECRGSRRPSEYLSDADGKQRTNDHTNNRLKAYFAEPEPAEV